ncbi:MAG: N-acetylglucosamine-6-phosphate deacetylase [Clostridia bacterium]|nr:N-acetylglucosamine-6-phosphate deacetylase [Clostridia bacterium]
MIKEIRGADIVLGDRIISNGTIRYADGIITYIGNECLPSAGYVIDGKGYTVMAGFVDIHCHGGGGYDFMDASPEEMLEISRHHLCHGTTTLIATTMTDTYEAIQDSLDRYAELYNNDNLLTLSGVHLEGPWLSPLQCGAQSTDKMAKPDAGKLKQLVKKYPFIKRVTAAPETEGGMELGNLGRALGLNMSAGHTDADFETIDKARGNGYTTLTHFYSGMTGVFRKNAYRTAGAVEAGLYFDDLTVEVIADGKHLPAGLLKLIYKCKGADKICLITDAMRGAGAPDGTETVLGRLSDGVPCIIEDGVAKLYDRQSFAGSVATADRLLRTMHTLAEVPLTDISKMLSANPAKLLGLSDRGVLEVGKRADIVVLNKDLTIKNVIFKGETVK